MPALPIALLKDQGRTEIEAALIPSDTRLGPAMTSLTPKARGFVLAVVEMGGGLNEMHLAAQKAGYTGDIKTMYVQAHRLAADPRIQAAIVEEAKARCNSASLLAISTMIDIMQDTKAKHATRLAAASRVAAIAGMDPAGSLLIKHDVNVSVTVKEQIKQVKALAKDLGLDPNVLLGKAGVTIEGEFTEAEPETAGTTEGLEDLL